MIEKILWCFLLCATSCCAHFTEEERREEDRLFSLLQNQAHEILEPLRMQRDQAKEVAMRPVRERIQEIENQIFILDEKNQDLEHQTQAIDDQFRQIFETLEVEKNQAEENEVTPLRCELERKRSPILAQTQELTQRRDKILADCYQLKAHPVWGRWWDQTDSLDVGLKCFMLEEQIQKLYLSVDGDLPNQISAAQKKVSDRYAEVRAQKSNEKYQALQGIEKKKRQNQSVLETLKQQLSSLFQEEAESIRTAVPDPEFLNRLEEEVFRGLMTGENL